MTYRGFTLEIARDARHWSYVAHCRHIEISGTGHAGKRAATAMAMESVDLQLAGEADEAWRDLIVDGIVDREG